MKTSSAGRGGRSGGAARNRSAFDRGGKAGVAEPFDLFFGGWSRSWRAGSAASCGPGPIIAVRLVAVLVARTL